MAFAWSFSPLESISKESLNTPMISEKDWSEVDENRAQISLFLCAISLGLKASTPQISPLTLQRNEVDIHMKLRNRARRFQGIFLGEIDQFEI
jgi:hypothetical protein